MPLVPVAFTAATALLLAAAQGGAPPTPGSPPVTPPTPGSVGTPPAVTPGRPASKPTLAPDAPKGAPTALPPAKRGAGAALPPNKLSAQEALARLIAERDRFWQNARKEIYKSPLELQGQHQAELAAGLRYAKLLRGDIGRKRIALTFDDGPHPAYTPRILQILKQEHVKATFFVVGEMAEKYPNLIRDEIAGGHNVGNHTYHHVSLVKIPDEYVADEVKTCGQVLRSITGRAPHLFRPPGGQYNALIAETAEALGYVTVLWTDDPGDYASPGTDVILQRTLHTANPGGIILIHDGIEQTVEILPRMIRELRAQGYEFVTVDEMLADSRDPVIRRASESLKLTKMTKLTQNH